MVSLTFEVYIVQDDAKRIESPNGTLSAKGVRFSQD